MTTVRDYSGTRKKALHAGHFTDLGAGLGTGNAASMLSRVGATLLEIVQPLIEWADTQVGELEAARARYDRAAGVVIDASAGGR